MLLALDIGNTNIVFGVFKGESLFKHWKIRSAREKTCDEYAVTLLQLFALSEVPVEEIEDVIISSVVPPLTPIFQDLSQSRFRVKPLVVGPGLKTGMPILYENPLEVGADRIVLSVAAHTKYGGPTIVVDFGTATTFDAISPEGEYLGGAIAPGIQIASDALSQKTAKLPRIEIKDPKKSIGRTTVSSMQSGLFYGYIGLVTNIIGKFKEELGQSAKVVATGGFAFLFKEKIKHIDVYERHLILEGLRILHEKNTT